MDQETLIETLKQHYPRDTRKQLIKSIIKSEKDDDKDVLQKQYNIFNQIFSYVLKECNWNMPANSGKLDNKPLEVMTKVFPKLETTKWYGQQELISKQNINLVMGGEK
jgi:hypothetical protein